MNGSASLRGLLVAACLAAAGPAATVLAQPISPISGISGKPTRITVGSEPAVKEGFLPTLTARLTAADGSALGDQPIDFLFEVQLLGRRNALLGRATTDTGGVARLQFSPVERRYTVVARFTGGKGYAASQGTAKVTVTPVVKSLTTTERAPLRTVKTVMPRVIGIGVGALWLGLLALSITTVRFIRKPGSA